jgi:hypothetical protein
MSYRCMSRGEEATFEGFSSFPHLQTQRRMQVVTLYIPRPPQRTPGITFSPRLPLVTRLLIELPFRQLQPWRWHLLLRGSCSPPACHSVQIRVSSVACPSCSMHLHSTSQTVDPSRPDALPLVSALLLMICERLELRWPGIGCSCGRSVHILYWPRS